MVNVSNYIELFKIVVNLYLFNLVFDSYKDY